MAGFQVCSHRDQASAQFRTKLGQRPAVGAGNRDNRMPAKSIVSTLVTIWRLAVPYFRSEDRWPGRLLLAAVIAAELGLVAINVLLNEWNNRFYNALQDRNWDSFVRELLYFCVLAGLYI